MCVRLCVFRGLAGLGGGTRFKRGNGLNLIKCLTNKEARKGSPLLNNKQSTKRKKVEEIWKNGVEGPEKENRTEAVPTVTSRAASLNALLFFSLFTLLFNWFSPTFLIFICRRCLPSARLSIIPFNVFIFIYLNRWKRGIRYPLMLRLFRLRFHLVFCRWQMSAHMKHVHHKRNRMNAIKRPTTTTTATRTHHMPANRAREEISTVSDEIKKNWLTDYWHQKQIIRQTSNDETLMENPQKETDHPLLPSISHRLQSNCKLVVVTWRWNSVEMG